MFTSFNRTFMELKHKKGFVGHWKEEVLIAPLWN